MLCRARDPGTASRPPDRRQSPVTRPTAQVEICRAWFSDSFRLMNADNWSSTARFVVQKHAARKLHYDFRLERDGVFKSWAVPKGVPEQAGDKRLAIQVDDHALEFGDFEGTIADGKYGAGRIEVWDRGRYEVGDWQDDHVLFTLHGQRYQGRFRLIRFARGGPRAWLLMKCSDPPKDP